MAYENIIPLTRKNEDQSSPEPADRSQYSNIIRRIKNSSDEILRALIKEMFDNVDDFLFDLADKADTNQKQALYFDAMRIVRLRRDTIEKAYQHRIDASFNLGMMEHIRETPKDTGKSLLHLHNPDDLASFDLLDNEQLEESLAITNMVAKTNARLHKELFAVAQRFNATLSTNRFTADDHPLSIERLCKTFRDAVSVLDEEASIEIRLIIYKLFDRFVLSGFPQLYQEINKIFIQAGILPIIKTAIIKKSTSHSQPNIAEQETNFLTENVAETLDANAPSFSPAGIATSADYQHAKTPTFHYLKRLLSGESSETYSMAESVPNAASADAHTGDNKKEIDSIIAALTSLQHNMMHSDPDAPSIEASSHIKNALNTQLTETHTQSSAELNAENRDTIDIIGMLFEFILDDHNLDTAMKALLARLQIPILKVAVLDKRFFSSNAHPARKLLNALAKAGIGWSISENPDNDMLYQEIKSIVQRILDEFDDDVVLFEELLSGFIKFLHEQEHFEDTLQKNIGEIKQKVKETIEKRLTATQIPDAVQHFILGRWSEVLTLLGERDGCDSESWSSAINVMDNLLWSIEPKCGSTERKLLLMMIPQLLIDLETGAALTDASNEEIAAFSQVLERLHVASMRHVKSDTGITTQHANDQTTIGGAITESAVHIHDEIVLETTEDDKLAADENSFMANAIREVSCLSLGTWVEFDRPEKKSIRGKLIWKDDYFDSYTFVNRRFKVVVDDCRQGIARYFLENKARVINDIPLLDRALDAIMERLARASISNE